MKKVRKVYAGLFSCRIALYLALPASADVQELRRDPERNDVQRNRKEHQFP